MDPNQPGERRDGRVIARASRGLAGFWRRHKAIALVLAIGLLLGLVLGRALIQPYVLELRKLSFVAVIALPLAGLVLFLLRNRSRGVRIGVLLACLVLAVVLAPWEMRAYDYVRLYYRYRALPIDELVSLPVTARERIQPLNSVYSLAHEVMTETETPMPPDFVRVGEDYRWSIAIEPAYPLARLFSGVTELFDIPGTTPSTSFARENREAVSFPVGENLLFVRNARRAVIRRFGLGRFLSYEPAKVIYVEDGDGRWVQLVSLIRWRGLLFPYPEFGGVQVVRQAEGGLTAMLALALLGAGEWIPPEEISRHAFLDGQNIVPVEVSRFAAESFRFQNGFFAPFPGYHKGDVRIPDLPGDMNDQPFTAHFDMGPQGGKSALYHYFALEPFDPDKQGLNTSVFVPADGSEPVYVYRHHEQRGSLTGVSAISAKVMESRKNYDWSRNRPVEHRPYIKQMAGKKRFFWLTTVVTLKDGGEDRGRFIAGTVPDVVLTDAEFNAPVWVDPLDKEGWQRQLAETLEPIWERR